VRAVPEAEAERDVAADGTDEVVAVTNTGHDRTARALVGPHMLLAFGIASIATCVGVLMAALTLRGAFGSDDWKLAGVMTGTYIGGSINFVAIAREVGLSDSLFVAATAADNVLTALWMGATLLLPLWLRRLYPARRGAALLDGETASASLLFGAAELRIFDLLALVALGLAVLLCSQGLSSLVPAVPKVLWLTTLALAAAQVPAARALAGALQLGLVALNLFFVTIGIGSRVTEIFRVGPQVFWFTATVVAVHGLLMYGVARLVGLDVETASVASQAAVGGPSTAMALATARGWPELVLPGLLAGLLGYAIGNYAGLGIASLVRATLGG
jgi:uncharacterized membrane protein